MSGSKNEAGGWIFVGLLAVAVWFFWLRVSDWLATYRARNTYNLPNSKIHITSNRPHDCDFMTAPIGQKHCHYEPSYLARWVTLSTANTPIVYGNGADVPPP